MKREIGTVAVLFALATAAAAEAAPVTVQLRVEGHTATFFEGPVTTDAKVIDGHPCDGTNGGQNPSPGPTMTGALDDGVGPDGWDGTWYDGFDDFGIDRVGPDSTDFGANRYWGYALNWQTVNVGGCQQQVAAGDQVLFAYDYFSKTSLLELTGPSRAATGESVTLTVTDGSSGAPAAGAAVGGATTDPAGHAVVEFDSPGTRTLKAERADAVRSNALSICVYAPGSGDCGTDPAAPGAPPPPPAAGPPAADRTPPEVAISLRDGAVYRRGPRLLAGTSTESGGLHGVYVRLRKVEAGAAASRCRWWSARLERFTRPRPCERARFMRMGPTARWSYLLPERLRRGRYVVDAKAVDRSFNRGTADVSFRVR